MFEVAKQQRLGEVALVLEVVEEAALGDAGGGDQFLDRGGGKALGQHRFLGDGEQAFAGVAALAVRFLQACVTVPQVQLRRSCSRRGLAREAAVRRRQVTVDNRNF